MCADHEQVSVPRTDLCQDFLVDVGRLRNAELDGNVWRHGGCHSLQVAHESLTILQHQRRKIHRGEVREHIQQRQPSLVPASDRCSVIERMLRDLGEINWTEYVSNTDHRGASTSAE